MYGIALMETIFYTNRIPKQQILTVRMDQILDQALKLFNKLVSAGDAFLDNEVVDLPPANLSSILIDIAAKMSAKCTLFQRYII